MTGAGPPYLTRAGHVSTEIARRLIASEPGDRLPTVSQLATELGTGVSTVQRALAILTQADLLELDPRGKRGTYLRAIDRPGLWRAAQQSVMMGLMPLPYTRRYEGLATGLRAELERLDVPFSLAFMSGSKSRLDVIGTGQQFAVISRLAAEQAVEEGRPVTVCADFGPGTYVGGHALVWAGKRRKRSPRVGIDLQSYDQRELARQEFGDDAEYVDVPYLQVLPHLRAGHFDVTVWAADALTDVHDLMVTELTPRAESAAPAVNTSAVLVAAEGDTTMATLLGRELSVPAVRDIQEQVLAGTRVPRY
jgi:DNA-binding transcriptional ArsR family regulator